METVFMSREDSTFRKHDKNKVKRIESRPPYIRLSSEIANDKRGTLRDPEGEFLEVLGENPEETGGTTPSRNADDTASQPSVQATQLEVDEETNERLEGLFRAAEGRITRSSGVKYDWSKNLDPDNVLSS